MITFTRLIQRTRVAQDVWNALIDGDLAFADTRAGDLTETAAAHTVSPIAIERPA